MFNSIVLDVFIGLIFVYLLYSLLATILQEIVARWFNLRSRMLQMAIRRMLEDDNKYSQLSLINAVIEIYYGIVRFFYPHYKSKSYLTKAFFNYPTIKYLAQSSWQSKPAYLDPSNFSQTLIYMLRGDNYDGTSPQMSLIQKSLFVQKNILIGANTAQIDSETLAFLQKLFYDSTNDIDKFKSLLEKWFNDTMDRTSGWYKKQTRVLLFLIGFIMAYNFNIDTIAIYKLLAKDKTARQNLVTLAVNNRDKYETLVKQVDEKANKDSLTADTSKKGAKIIRHYIIVSDSDLVKARKAVDEDISQANMIAAIGRPDEDSCKICDTLKLRLGKIKNLHDTSSLKLRKGFATSNNKKPSKNDTLKLKKALDSIKRVAHSDSLKIKQKIDYYNKTFTCAGNPYQNPQNKFWGWLITALALSLGSTFWFDLLNRFIQLRGTGPKPQSDASNSTPDPSAGGGPGQSPTNRVG
ncbi:hypothetical protein ACEN9X_25915 [Mucilaginibacter sp. Mucisp86]|uniref:hypothetical protein n=1 Tax=Mucilaginibacter sp. Mucisp86 TaxID=3243060 RepID=UPI0039B582B0